MSCQSLITTISGRSGAAGRIRTADLALHPTSAFAAPKVRGLDYPFIVAPVGALDADRLVSTPSSHKGGLARDCHDPDGSKVSPNLAGFLSQVSL